MATRVLLVTTWDVPCGVAEHSYYLKESVERADPEIEIVPCPEALDPFALDVSGFDILHLNYQASLLSRYTTVVIEEIRWSCRRRGHRPIPVVVTYHDTGVPNSDQCKAICAAADAVVVHEPAEDLPGAHYWRMGVPARSAWLVQAWNDVRGAAPAKRCLGTIGFPFPWKHYDQLATWTAKVGWGLFLITPAATYTQIREWKKRNLYLDVRSHFVPRAEAVALLAACDATAFTYVCHNTGQSAAILQGIAAGRPVFAFSTCRQFRALYGDPLGRQAINWIETFEALADQLEEFDDRPTSTSIHALAEQESWTQLGVRYARLYRELVR